MIHTWKIKKYDRIKDNPVNLNNNLEICVDTF
jgi:hypothetical protein